VVVAIGRLALALPGVRSLKEKRSIVRRVVDRTANRFNVAIAEVDAQDSLQKAVIGMSVVSNDRRHANRMIDEVIGHAESIAATPVLHSSTELVSLSDTLDSGDRLPAWLTQPELMHGDDHE